MNVETLYKLGKTAEFVEYLMKHKLLQETDLTFGELEELGKRWSKLSTSHCLTSKCPPAPEIGCFRKEIVKYKQTTREGTEDPRAA